MDETDDGRKQIVDDEPHHVAPEHSPQHLALLAAARKAQKDTETLRDILWLINAHDRLLGLGQIAENLLKILEPQLSKEPLPAEDVLAMFRGWPDLLKWICETNRDPRAAADDNPVRGNGLVRNPLYGCLWHVPADSRWRSRYRMLQWHLLYAHSSYLYKESKIQPQVNRSAYETYGGEKMWEVFPDPPNEAALAVRAMAKLGWEPLLKELPLKLSPVKFARAIGDVPCPPLDELGSDPEWGDKRTKLRLFLGRANGLTPWLKRPGAHGGSSAARYQERELWSVDTTPGDEDDPDARWPRSRWVTVSSLIGEPKRNQFLDLDLDPDDISPPEHRFQIEPEPVSPNARELAVESALAARGQCRHVELAHQLLPWQYNQLTLQELVWLRNRSDNAIREFSHMLVWDEEQYRIAERVALIYVMLWTGSPLDRARDLKVLRKEDSEQYREEQILEIDLLFELDKQEWRIHPTIPQYSSQIPDPMQQAHPLATTFCLPDIAEVGHTLRKLFDHRPETQARTGDDPLSPGGRLEAGYLFARGLDEYREDLKTWLRKQTPGFGAPDMTGRVTVGRIATFLFNRLLAATGDVTAAVLITGHKHPLARTQQFYSTYSVAELRKIYLDVTSSVVSQANMAAEPATPEPSSSPESLEEKEFYVGARLCAKHSSVKDAIYKLQEKIGELSQNRDRAESIDYHNLFTLHTVLLFAYATSIRAISTPYLFPEEIDEVTGFTLISDKDDETQHKTRLAWVPPFVHRQMRNYRDHLFAVVADNPRAHDSFGNKPCFFLDVHDRPKDVRPATLGLEMAPFLALPPNSHRRFMRRQLLGHGCPPEVVNVWLNHAFQGEEPWGTHSSFSFAEYQTSLKDHLLPVLEELGWKNLKSPLT